MKTDTVLKKNLYMIRIIWEVSRSYFFYAFLLITIQVFNNILFILVGKFVIDILTNGDEFYKVLIYCGILIVTNLLQQFFSSWYYMKRTKLVTLKVQEKFQIKMFEKAKQLDLYCYESGMFYDQYVKAMPEADGRAMAIFNTFVDFIKSILNIFSVIAILISLDVFMISFTIINIFISLLLSNKKNKSIYIYDQEEQNINRQRSYVKRIFYLPEYAKELKLYPVAYKLIKKYSDETNKLKALINKYFTKIFLIDSSIGASNSVISVLMILYLSYSVSIGRISIGDFLALEKSTGTLSSSIRNVFNIITELKRHSLYIDNFLTFINYDPIIKIDDRKEDINTDEEFSYSLKNVNFTYPGSTNRVLSNINLEIKKGEKIAIVGYNGAGKTTLVKLLLRLYDADDGSICINGKSVKEYNVKSIWNNTGVVFQDSNFYALSIRDNIVSEYAEHNDEEIYKALEKVNLFSKIKELPLGIDTIVSKELSQDGIVLSGGEQQSLFLSRIFLNNQKAIILDEPSSALDPIAEDKILSEMFDAAVGKTVIMIAHRLSSIKFVDRIIFMEKGEIKEMGTHDELMKLDKKYAEMYKIQAKRYFSIV